LKIVKADSLRSGGQKLLLLQVTSFHGVKGGAVSRWQMEAGKPVLKEWLRY
jgi:hypothetical protein